jgi:hypothetical protein
MLKPPSQFGEFVVYHSMLIVSGRGDPGPYLDKKLYIVRVGTWFPHPASYFSKYHKYRCWIWVTHFP